jgi:Cap4 dsDNA endonuclease
VSLTPSTTSYHDLPPLENGGVVARIGFDFQDHVAAGYCIDMLGDIKIIEIWCETLDDITIVSDNNGQEEFEFIQVKSNTFDHLWSTAELCKRKNKNKSPIIGSSILEKSLAYDRGKEICYFRVVTSFAVNEDLKILTHPLDSPARNSNSKTFTNLCNQIESKVPDYKSPNGNTPSFWLSRTKWEVCHSDESLKNANLLKLRKTGSNLSINLVEDQWDELYIKILQKVQDAGKAKWESNSEAKKIKKTDFLTLIKDLVNKAQNPAAGGKGEQLKEKMKYAQIPHETIEIAQRNRISYRRSVLNPGYMDLSKREEVEREILAHLNLLLSKLDAGKINDNGVEFHCQCLTILENLHKDRKEIPFWLLQGYMYSITDRCVYRFTRTII